MTYDYIVVGAGSAGCVVASRLSEDPAVRVLVLEAGPPDDRPGIHTPGEFLSLWFTDVAWQYFTEDEPQLTRRRSAPQFGRKVFWPRGRTLGGSSAISSMVYMRGNPRDFDHWNYLGNEGWSYQQVLPFFRKSENQEHGADRWHGAGGPMDVTDLAPPNPVSVSFVEACVGLGYARSRDFNAGEQDGAGLVQVNVRGGRRVSAASAFLTPVRTARPNLEIRTGARARRVVLDRGRAVGVEYVNASGGREEAACAQEVVVSCGSVDSPKLLLLSGIGPADQLRELGIRVAVDLPGVGANLQDHPVVALGYSYAEGTTSAPPAAGAAEACLFLRTRDGLLAAPPDLQLHFAHWLLIDPEYLTPPLPPPAGFAFVPTCIRPQSRGTVGLRSPDPDAPPLINPNYFESSLDLDVLLYGLKTSRRIAASRQFDRFRGREVAPGPEVSDDASLRDYIRLAAAGLFHPTGTCRMGHDRHAVVTPRLEVHQVKGLRVADASVMPAITSGNTHAPTVMIGERAADFIQRARQRRESRET